MYKILAVDDENDITESLRKGLTRHGFDVSTYNDPTQALSSFESERYDLALIDINMAKMNGFELCHALKSKDENVKVCFLSAYESDFSEFRHLFPTYPELCFIRKPVSIQHLVGRIKSELGGGHT